jgi:hypothetical protein
MSRSRFSPQLSGQLVGLIMVGASLPEACRQLGIPEPTVKGWLARGRKESGTTYAEFARAVEDARATVAQAELTWPEFMGCLAVSVRKGSVQAMKLWWEIHRAREADEPEYDPLEEFDELATRRSRHNRRYREEVSS